MTDLEGGYRCPYCRHTEVVPSLLLDHIKRDHPEETV